MLNQTFVKFCCVVAESRLSLRERVRVFAMRRSTSPQLAPSVHRPRIGAFTLVEVLIVMSLILILAGIALPTTKELLSDQKASRTAQSIAAFIDRARSDAVAKGVHVGVRIERFDGTADVTYGSAAAVRIFRITGVPDYSGEAADAKVEMTVNANGLAELRFKKSDNLLLSLYDKPEAPVSDGDLIELPGGRQFPLDFIGRDLGPPVFIKALIDINSPVDTTVSATNTSTETFPAAHLGATSGDYQYRIHRKPVVSPTSPLALSRGIAIDLNYSGIGLTGNQFAPLPETLPNAPIDILFGPDGRVAFMSIDNQGNIGPAVGMIYLCLGTTDGIVEPPDRRMSATTVQLFENQDRFRPNITIPDSIWIVINPSTGRVVAAPFAAVTDMPASIGEGLADARALVTLGDTLEAKP